MGPADMRMRKKTPGGAAATRTPAPEQGQKINWEAAKDKDGFTALMHAQYAFSRECVEKLSAGRTRSRSNICLHSIYTVRRVELRCAVMDEVWDASGAGRQVTLHSLVPVCLCAPVFASVSV